MVPYPRVQLNVLLGQDCALQQEENLLLKSPKLQKIIKTTIKQKTDCALQQEKSSQKAKKDRKIKRQKDE